MCKNNSHTSPMSLFFLNVFILNLCVSVHMLWPLCRAQRIASRSILPSTLLRQEVLLITVSQATWSQTVQRLSHLCLTCCRHTTDALDLQGVCVLTHVWQELYPLSNLSQPVCLVRGTTSMPYQSWGSTSDLHTCKAGTLLTEASSQFPHTSLIPHPHVSACACAHTGTHWFLRQSFIHHMPMLIEFLPQPPCWDGRHAAPCLANLSPWIIPFSRVRA